MSIQTEAIAAVLKVKETNMATRLAVIHEDHPYALRGAVTEMLRMTRQEFADRNLPQWRKIRNIRGDPLAFRSHLLHTEGHETLVNCIRQDHGLDNKY